MFGAAYIIVALQGKAFAIKQLENLTRKKVSIGYIRLTPPLNLDIVNLKIQDNLTAKSVFISPSIFSLIMGDIILNNVTIIRPELTCQRNLSKLTLPPQTAGGVVEPAALPETGITSKEAPKAQRKNPPRFIIKHLKIKDGNICFVDNAAGQNGIKINVKDLYFSITNLYVFPLSAVANFELQAKIPWQQGAKEGKIEAEGWINLYKKDIQATLKIEDIDGIYLYPYYANWVDLEKARIEKAKLNFTSNIQGLNNNVTAECHLELTDVVRKPRPSEEPQEKAEKIADAVFDIFRALNQGKILLNFTIRTKMDRPEFGFGTIKMAFEDKLAQRKDKLDFTDILMLPAKIVEGTVRGATDVSKALVEGSFAVGNEFKKALEAAFKKEKQE